MAKFGESILEYKNTAKFSLIPITCVEDQWYITIGRNSIINVQDSKTRQTWTLAQGHIHKFTTPVAYFDGKLFSVMDKMVLLKWSIEDDNLDKAEKYTFDDEVIHALIHLKEMAPLIIFKSGKFAVADSRNLSSDLKPTECLNFSDDDTIEWVDATTTNVSIDVFCRTYNKETKLQTLYHFSVHKDDGSISPVHVYNFLQDNESVTKCCCINNQDISLYYLRSDGSLRCYDVKSSKDTLLLPIDDIHSDTCVDIGFFDPGHIALSKIPHRGDACTVEIWDTKKAILRGRKSVPPPEECSMQVSATKQHIFINFINEKLIVIPFFLDTSFFATLNTCAGKEFQELSWNEDLEVAQIQDARTELEKMDISASYLDTQDSLDLIKERLLNQDSADLKLIPESELVKVLQLVISCKKLKDQKSFDDDMYRLLNIIFSASFNDTLLVKYLKKLNVEDTLMALELLLSYWKQTVNTPDDAHKPSDLQIVNWMCLMINSHTEALLFTKEKAVKKLLKNLYKTLSEKMEEFEELEGLQGYVSLLQKKDILPQECSVEKYSIETLDI